jgi:hypothetical protein
MLTPEDIHITLQLDGLAERERHRRQAQPAPPETAESSQDDRSLFSVELDRAVVIHW